MRYREIASGFRVPLSGEETALIDRLDPAGTPVDALVDERDQEVALGLFRRGLLNKIRDKHGRSVYQRSIPSALDRD